MTGVLPSRQELTRVVAALTEDLPARWPTLLADPRWADVVGSVERLAVPGAVAALAAELGDEEAGRLAALLRDRWAAVGDVALPPAAAVTGPAAVSAGGTAELHLVVDGLDDGWTAVWRGPVEAIGDEPPGMVPDLSASTMPSPDAGTRGEVHGLIVRLTAGQGPTARASVRVFGRSSAGRTILTADAVLAVEPGDHSAAE